MRKCPPETWIFSSPTLKPLLVFPARTFIFPEALRRQSRQRPIVIFMYHNQSLVINITTISYLLLSSHVWGGIQVPTSTPIVHAKSVDSSAHRHKKCRGKTPKKDPPSSLLRPVVKLINFGYARRAIELVTIPIVNLFLLSNSLCGHNLSQALEARCLQPCRMISLVM